MSNKAFQTLLPAFYQAYEDDLDNRDAKRKHKRQRERGGGRQGKKHDKKLADEQPSLSRGEQTLERHRLPGI